MDFKVGDSFWIKKDKLEETEVGFICYPVPSEEMIIDRINEEDNWLKEKGDAVWHNPYYVFKTKEECENACKKDLEDLIKEYDEKIKKLTEKRNIFRSVLNGRI